MRNLLKRPICAVLVLVILLSLMPIQVPASVDEENLWNGRSAVFVGDSITAGTGTTKIYYEYLKEILGLSSVTAMGVAGSCISAASDYGQSNQPLTNRHQDIPSADLIVIFMGTNDYGHETPLGSVEDTQDGTFYGALNVIIPALVAKHTSGKLVFVTPLHRYGFGTSKILGTQFTSDSVANGVGATLGDYVEALKTVCANNGVSVIDLYTECTLDPSDVEVRAAYMPDGLHPNAAGHEVIAGIMASHILAFEPTEQEPIELTEMVYGNRFASGFNQENRASSRINFYLKAGTVITLKNADVMQWACTKTSDENSSSNLGYFPDSGWSDKETAVVAEDGWIGFTFKYRDETQSFDLTKPLSDYITIEEPHTHTYENGICTGCGAEDPDAQKSDLLHIICYGQSFSTGSDAPVYPDPAVDGVYVYGSITDSSKGEKLAPLASTGNQHPIISAGNVLAQMLKNAGYDADIVLGSYGSGGRTIAQLMSAERQAEIKAEEGYTYDIYSSGRYSVFQNSVAAIADYAIANEQNVSCPIIVYLQGETDQNTDAELGYPDNAIRAGYGAGGDKEKYKEYMTRLKEDMQKEVMEAYGQTEKPLFLIYQVSGTYVRTKYSSINMAQLEFAQENDDVILVQTPYFTPHYTNSHHLTVNGYRWLGEYIGQTMYTALTTQEKTWPVLPKKFTVEDTSTLRITVSGAVNGLTIDTWTVEDATNASNLYGFYLMINGSRVAPQTVTLDGNDIILTLPENAIPLNKAESVYVYYGGQGAKGTGNIRDNCSKTGFYCYLDDSADTGTGNNQGVSHSALDENGNSLIGQPYPLYNWLASFCYEIEVPEAEQEQAAFYHWEMQETGLVCVSEDQNDLTLLQGSVENGVLMNVQYSMDETVVLYHNKPWAIEWKAAGNGNSYGGGMLLVAADGSDSKAGSLYIPADSRGMVAWNVSSESRNYGFKLGTEGIDTRQEHTYRIENRIAADGTNTVYLIVDGVEIGAMNSSFSTSNSSQSDELTNWANGADIFLSYMGKPSSFLLKNLKLSYLKIWEETHTHSYESVVTAPTCTEQGYTTYTCDCGDSYVDDYVDATGEHIYENGVCTGCGTEHPNLANYEGKVISILGDSISTFAGYIPVADGFNLQHYARYPQDNLFTDVEHTWWMQMLTALNAKLGINESWRSTEVYNYIDAEVNSSYDGTKACMASITRIQNLGSNGTPDVILFFGGTNDITQSRPVGTFDPSTAPREVDLTSVKWDTVADAYVDAIMRMQYYYPEAQIVAMLPFDRNSQGTAKVDQYNSLFISICEHYGVPYVDLRECGISNADLPDGTHPDATGMDYITEAVLDMLLNDMEMEAGEHIIHSVTHNLNGAESSLGYYKSITHGKSFVTTITGENVTVSVTMGGVDITDTAYANSVVTIAAVTGDVVITAQGRVKPIYEDHLQQLPENLCCSTNLWSSLVSENTYYTGSAWGNVSGNSVYSITIPVAAGDQIWATSFQKSGTNGGSRNGIRLTWFDESGVLESVSPDNVYTEFSANGYLTAPEGVVAVNVVMWNGNESNEVYILNRDHCYENGVCAVCSALDVHTALDAFDHTVDVEEKTVTLTQYIGSDTSVILPPYYVIDGVHYAPVLNSETIFSGNTSITSVILRSGVRFAGNTMYKLFAGCSNLTTVDMTGVDTSCVTSMRELFSLCKKLANVYGYENWDTGKVESIFKAFNQVQKMEKIDLSRWDLSRVTNSGWCFQLCYAKAILLPDNLAVMSAGFFNHATKVEGASFVIPAGVKKIGYAHTIYDFATDDFVEFIVAEGNAHYIAIDGILYSADGTEMLAIPRNKPFENGVYEIPEGVTFLGELSFSRNYNIETLVLPDSYVIECIDLYDDRYVVFEDVGNINVGTNLTIAIYCYTGITDYAVKESNPNYTSVDGIIYSKDMTAVVAIPTRYGRTIVIPEGVTIWNQQAMWNDTEVADLYANNTVDKLLSACGGVHIPSTMISIDGEQMELLNRLKYKYADSFVITVHEDNPVYCVDAEGYLRLHAYENGVCTYCENLDVSLLLLGDLNLDGDVDAEDLTILARHVAGIEALTNAAAMANADVNGDGTIDAEDLTMHARYVAGIITNWGDASESTTIYSIQKCKLSEPYRVGAAHFY